MFCYCTSYYIFANPHLTVFLIRTFLLCRLHKEAARQRNIAMDLERKAEALRTGRPMKIAEQKEVAAQKMRQDVVELEKEAAGELKDAERKRAEAERAAPAAAAKVTHKSPSFFFFFFLLLFGWSVSNKPMYKLYCCCVVDA